MEKDSSKRAKNPSYLGVRQRAPGGEGGSRRRVRGSVGAAHRAITDLHGGGSILSTGSLNRL